MTLTLTDYRALGVEDRVRYLATLSGLRAKPLAVREAYEVAVSFGMNSTVTADGDSNAKLAKSGELAVTIGLNLMPADGAGKNVCPYSTPNCRRVCLGIAAGRNVQTSVQAGKVKRNLMFFADRDAFYLCVAWEISRAVRNRPGKTVAVRLNVTSDLNHAALAPYLFLAFPEVQFYDYTKGWDRITEELPANYDITVSWSEESVDSDLASIREGRSRVAVVFDEIPTTWRGLTVIDGDETDARWLDPLGVVVGLKAKGAAKRDTSGFVQIGGAR